MNHPAVRWTVVALACLLAAACQDKHQPVKPTVQASSIAAPA